MSPETLRTTAFIYAALATLAPGIACVFLLRMLRGLPPYRKLANTLFPLSQVLLSACAVWAEVTYGLSMGVAFVTATATLASAVYDVFLFRRLRTAEENEVNAYESALLVGQLKAQARHTELLEQDVKRAGEIRSQMRDDLGHVVAFLQAGDKASAQAALASAAETIVPLNPALCASPVLDALLAAKVRRARELGVPLDIHVDVPAESLVSDVELCAVFANLIDNALNATAPLGEGAFVEIRAMTRAGWLLVDVRNACPPDTRGLQEVATGTRSARAPKPLSDEHGWGRQIVDRLARRHEGGLAVKVAGCVYSAQVTMRVG